jgi:hypothetical protein
MLGQIYFILHYITTTPKIILRKDFNVVLKQSYGIVYRPTLYHKTVILQTYLIHE